MNKRTLKFVTEEEITNEEFDLIYQMIQLRKNNSFSQADLSKTTGISQPNIARFEKNIHSAKMSTVLKILDSMGYKLKIVKK